ncbi:alpha-glucosidase [Halanaerobium sp.]|jgi:oligo-1,6-glucosidase|uniref:alpha-glucosidase n=1 Tax=Halanaerobium sp. TaxID=1895664 RepID=UPI000DE5EF17|nr:alpha-glucosidase [Halanaerobium sp.]PUU87905.1 MAG: Trehalose-6-phosphate hydrolase [Halanaerobium sp.]
MKNKRKWWKEAVVYQIYPRSFNDSNNDRIGDLNGIIEKLDYLKELGVDVIWLSPIYESPNDDNGYDISDYYRIMEEFGTMDDFDNLLEKIHKKDMKLIMDLVINHTSDEHYWFKESSKSKDNKYADYYIWRDPVDGKPPNNWESRFSGPAWTYCESREQYYLHLFSKKQPDLNWENKEVKKDIFKMIDWWLNKGIDGFRMDVINFIAKKKGLPDSIKPDSPEKWSSLPESHKILKELRTEVINDYDVMTVGETPFVTPKDGHKYVNRNRNELDMIFHFEHVHLNDFNDENFLKFKDIQNTWYKVQENGGWLSQYFANHDQPRPISKFFNDDKYREESAKLVAMMLLTLPGTPYIYQGEEIGMTNVDFSSIKDYNDIRTINKYYDFLEKNKEDDFFEKIKKKSRDNARTPMQWSDEKYSGFSNVEPWLKINPNYKKINVKNNLNNFNSVYNFYKKLIKFKKNNRELTYSNYKDLLKKDREIYYYKRSSENNIYYIILNFTNKLIDLSKKDIEINNSKNLIVCNYTNYKHDKLSPYEARLYKVKR